eukprot:591207-Hanusia_phi.AAC.2
MREMTGWWIDMDILIPGRWRRHRKQGTCRERIIDTWKKEETSETGIAQTKNHRRGLHASL